MFLDLVAGADLSMAPEWMQALWSECENLNEEMPDWFTRDGEPMIGAYIDEFRKTTFAYIKSGIIAHEIRLRRHYLSISNSFTAFCEKWLGRSIWQVNRLIDAAAVAVKLMAMGFCELPANEAQCRPLIRLSDQDLEIVWCKVCRFIPEKDRTAKSIEAIANRAAIVDPDFQGKPAQKRIEVNAEQWAKLEEAAGRYGMKPKDYLDLLLDKELGDEPSPEPAPEPKPETKRKKSKMRFRPKKAIGFIQNGYYSFAGIPKPT